MLTPCANTADRACPPYHFVDTGGQKPGSQSSRRAMHRGSPATRMCRVGEGGIRGVVCASTYTEVQRGLARWRWARELKEIGRSEVKGKEAEDVAKREKCVKWKGGKLRG